MSVSISQFQTVEMGDEGTRLASYDPVEQEVTLWPQRVGVGPSITMTLAEWRRVNEEVRLAMLRAESRRK